MSIITKFDLLGHLITFEHGMNGKYQTIQGGVLSLMIIIATTILTCMFGRDIYERKVPIVTITNSVTNSSLVHLKKLPFFFQFLQNGVPMLQTDAKKWFKGSFSVINIDANGKQSINVFSMIPCDWAVFTEYNNNDLFNTYNNQANYFCLDLTKADSFSGLYYGNNSNTVVASFTYLCKSVDVGCGGDFKVILYYADSLIDNKNFLVPVKSHISNLSLTMSLMVRKYLFMRFTNDIFVSDNGWILEDNFYYPHIKMNNLYTDYSYANSEIELKLPGFSIILESPSYNITYTRFYIKIQELIAKIGGLINGIMVFIYIFFSMYFKFTFIEYLREETMNYFKIDPFADNSINKSEGSKG